MNYKKDLSEQNQKLLLKINVNVEDREYLTEEVEKNINDIGNYIISKSSKNGDINRAQLEYMPLINVLENYIEKNLYLSGDSKWVKIKNGKKLRIQ